MEFVDVPRLKHVNNPKSTFRDKYIQPPKARSCLYNRPFKKPTLKIESDTTYGLSYSHHKFDPRCKFHYGSHEKVPRTKPGKFDFDTTYKLSYQLSNKVTRTKMFVPRSCLSIKGSHDMKSTHMLSYMNPGHSRAIICEPYRGKVHERVPMDSKTVMKESYQEFGFVKVGRPVKREVWRTKFKTDYQTTNQLSYQYTGPVARTRGGRYRPSVSGKIEKDTVYSESYQVPGRFVNGDVC